MIQIETTIPEDGNLVISLPQSLWGKTVKLAVKETEKPAKTEQSPPDLSWFIGCLAGRYIDMNSIREEEDSMPDVRYFDNTR
ncbi:MAG: hypothetical protein FWE67_12660 [Planctomycetaceae bacterium]|nr:hypothetical protein [Planctomycetaceae bacterium]